MQVANKFRPPKKKIDLILSPSQLNGDDPLPSYLFPTQAPARQSQEPSATGNVARITEQRPKPQIFNRPDYKPGSYQPQLQSIKSYASGGSIPTSKNTKTENKEQSEVNAGPSLSLEEAWSALSGLMRAKGRISLANTLLRKPELKEGQIVEFRLDNSAQEEDILPEKQEMLDFIRQKTGNKELQLNLVVLKSNEVEKKLLGPKEKYQILVEKNPLIKQLKDRLDLDIEY